MATIVLIHGAYMGGWIWKPVAARLRAAGHDVWTPTLEGCGERGFALRPGITVESQAAEVAQMLFYRDLEDVVLVGTSSGGMVMCKVAQDQRERVARLVFIDALALFDGECLLDIVLNRPPAVTTDLAIGLTPEDAEARFAGLEPGRRAWALERHTPQPVAVIRAPVVLPAFWSQAWRSTVIWCRRGAYPPRAHQQRTADRPGGRWVELDTGHYPMLSDPDTLVRELVA